MVHDMDDSAAIVHAAPVEPSEVLDLATSFELFVNTETVRFHGALRLLARDRAEAEDLMQDAFLRVWERWEHVRSLDDPRGYLFRTAMNLHRKRLPRAAVAIRHAVGRRRPRSRRIRPSSPSPASAPPPTQRQTRDDHVPLDQGNQRVPGTRAYTKGVTTILAKHPSALRR